MLENPSKERLHQPSFAPPPVTLEMLQDAFQGTFQPIRETWIYRVGLFLTTCIMLLLPLLYAALILGAAWLFYSFALTYPTWTATFFGTVIYISLLAAGASFLGFMLQPFFPNPEEKEVFQTLSRDEHPLLFSLVAHLCHTLRTPMPKHIEVDLQVNASARFQPGLLNFLQRKMVLRLGLPLIAGLDLRQFTGVLAHELGHFSQGTGMRLGYLIRKINHWLVRTVYERGPLEIKMRELSESQNFWLVWWIYPARFFLWVTRGVLWCLMGLGGLVSNFMTRQMEYDADRHQIRIVGSEVLGPTLIKVSHLEVASFLAYADLHEAWREGRLGDDFAALLVARLDKIDDKVAKDLESELRYTKTGIFDSHPSLPDRVKHAENEQAPGIFHLNLPASTLLNQFEELCKRQTIAQYKHVFEEKFHEESLISTPVLLMRQRTLEKEREAFLRSFQGLYLPLHPPRVRDLSPPPEEIEEATRELEEYGLSLLDQAPATLEAFLAYKQTEPTMTEDEISIRLIECQLTSSGDLNLYEALNKAREKKKDTLDTQRDAFRKVEEFTEICFQRLMLALRLLSHPHIQQRLEKAKDFHKEAEKLLQTWRFLRKFAHELHTLRDDFVRLITYLQGFQQLAMIPNAHLELERNQHDIYQNITGFQKALAKETYPFEHAKSDIDLATYAIETIPENQEDINALLQTAEGLLDRTISLFLRILGRLSFFCEAVEDALGLEPLPDPDIEKIDRPEIKPHQVTSTR